MLLFLILGACTVDYKETYQKEHEDMSVQIDTTKWEKVYMQLDEENHLLLITDGKHLPNKIFLWDAIESFFLGLIIGIIFMLIIILIHESNKL